MSNTEQLLDTIICATREAARVVRRIVSCPAYYKYGKARRFRSANDHHVARGLDRAAHNIIVRRLQANFPDVPIISEEVPNCVKYGEYGSSELCFITDPLDGTAFARYRIPPASCSLCAYSLREQRPIASAVTDVFGGWTYFAADHLSQAEGTLGNVRIRLQTSGLTEAINMNCSALSNESGRFVALTSQHKLTPVVGWLLNSGGAIDICRVASGDLDATVEFAKGFRIWDVIAAAHVLEKAGGFIGLPDGDRIRLASDTSKRFRFVAAATEELFKKLQQLITWPS